MGSPVVPRSMRQPKGPSSITLTTIISLSCWAVYLINPTQVFGAGRRVKLRSHVKLKNIKYSSQDLEMSFFNHSNLLLLRYKFHIFDGSSKRKHNYFCLKILKRGFSESQHLAVKIKKTNFFDYASYLNIVWHKWLFENERT